MSQAEHAHITPTSPASSPPDEFNSALCDANTIASMIDYLADHAISGGATIQASHLLWLAAELNNRLERIEVAEMRMRGARA